MRREMDRRVVQIVDRELDEHEIGRVFDAEAFEETSLVPSTISPDSEIDDFDARLREHAIQFSFEKAREGLLFLHTEPERNRVSEHEDAIGAGLAFLPDGSVRGSRPN